MWCRLLAQRYGVAFLPNDTVSPSCPTIQCRLLAERYGVTFLPDDTVSHPRIPELSD
jgi:hypothetical protein